MQEEHILFIHDAPSDSIALKDDLSGQYITYGKLRIRAEYWKDKFKSEEKKLILLFLDNSIKSVEVLLGTISSGNAVALLDPNLSLKLQCSLIEFYQPDIIINTENKEFNFDGYNRDKEHDFFSRRDKGSTPPIVIHPDLCLLLSTSGSTGSPKFVRLTKSNIIQNAKAIANVLKIDATDVALAHLPLHYSYGLSVLTSFLIKYSAISLTKFTFMDKEFWDLMKTQNITHMSGVPFHYKMMTKLGFKRLKLDKLKVMTQAGGKLDNKTQRIAHDYMSSIGGRFYVMYGQTEASPRITTLSHDDFNDNIGSVGNALPNGVLQVLDEKNNVVLDGEEGNIFYQGPNVMMGYAEEKDDLKLGDINKGLLATGDIGYINNDKFLFITGRSKRVGKVYGLRVNLDEIESFIAGENTNAVIQVDDEIIIFVQNQIRGEKEYLIEALQKRFSLPKGVYKIIESYEIPRTSRNKPDYKRLEQDFSNVQ